MNRIPVKHHVVDRVGYKQISTAARCERASKADEITAMSQPNREPVPAESTRKRSRLLIRYVATGGNPLTAYLSNDGVNATQGYPLRDGETLDLPVSPNVRIFAVRQGGIGDNSRTAHTRNRLIRKTLGKSDVIWDNRATFRPLMIVAMFSSPKLRTARW